MVKFIYDRRAGKVFELLDMVAKARLKLNQPSLSPTTGITVQEAGVKPVGTTNGDKKKKAQTQNQVPNNEKKGISGKVGNLNKTNSVNIHGDKRTSDADLFIHIDDPFTAETDSLSVAKRLSQSINSGSFRDDDNYEEEDDAEDANYENLLDSECERLRLLLEDKFRFAESLRNVDDMQTS